MAQHVVERHESAPADCGWNGVSRHQSAFGAACWAGFDGANDRGTGTGSGSCGVRGAHRVGLHPTVAKERLRATHRLLSCAPSRPRRRFSRRLPRAGRSARALLSGRRGRAGFAGPQRVGRVCASGRLARPDAARDRRAFPPRGEGPGGGFGGPVVGGDAGRAHCRGGALPGAVRRGVGPLGGGVGAPGGFGDGPYGGAPERQAGYDRAKRKQAHRDLEADHR